VEQHTVSVWSDGNALDADLFWPREINGLVSGGVLAHVWGDRKQTGERYAARFAARDMIALSFTQTGWSGLGGALRVGSEGGEPTSPREVDEPIARIPGFLCAADYLKGKPGFALAGSAPEVPVRTAA
jgi:hypothetical protein